MSDKKKTLKEQRIQAVKQFHGGFEGANYGQIKTLWDSLPADVQERYLNSIKSKSEVSNADSTGT